MKATGRTITVCYIVCMYVCMYVCVCVYVCRYVCVCMCWKGADGAVFYCMCVLHTTYIHTYNVHITYIHTAGIMPGDTCPKPRFSEGYNPLNHELVYGVWCMVYGVWCMVRVVWCVVSGVIMCVSFA